MKFSLYLHYPSSFLPPVPPRVQATGEVTPYPGMGRSDASAVPHAVCPVSVYHRYCFVLPSWNVFCRYLAATFQTGFIETFQLFDTFGFFQSLCAVVDLGMKSCIFKFYIHFLFIWYLQQIDFVSIKPLEFAGENFHGKQKRRDASPEERMKDKITCLLI